MTATPTIRTRTLSKSDFQLASSCEAKLYFRKNGYADNRDEKPHLAMLAYSGYMVEALAKAGYPTGIHFDHSGDQGSACQRTCEQLQSEGATLFEGALLWNRRFARADVLQRKGDTIRLIEIKSGTIDGAAHQASLDDGKRGVFLTARKPFRVKAGKAGYLEDLTYQVLIAERLFPGLRIEPFLRLVDTSRYVTVEDAHALFEIISHTGRDGVSRLQTARFTGDASLLAQLDIITEVSVAAEVALLRDAVEERAARLESLLDAPLSAFAPERCHHCRDCEFRVDNDEPDGFGECWGELATVKPHVLDLYRVDKVSGPDGRGIVEWLFDAGKASMFDIPEDRLANGGDSPGSIGERQRRQIAHTRSGEFWISGDLRSHVEAVSYPAHFIDFEAATPALPYHAKMRPYGQVAFQWSCHAVEASGAQPVHTEWLNSGYEWPNEKFVRTLREQIGDTGSVIVWTAYERTALRGVMRDLAKFGVVDPALTAWITDVTENRLVDMYKWATEHFYHPGMGGSASIKVVLDALWQSESQVRADFERLTGSSLVPGRDPYASLPAHEINGIERQVREGTGAVTGYEAMMYSEGRNDADVKSAWRELLLRYCALDTLSMVLIFEHLRRAVTTR